MRWILWMEGRMTEEISVSRWQNTRDLNPAAEDEADPEIGTREGGRTLEADREVMIGQEGRTGAGQDPDQEVKDVRRIDQDQGEKDPIDQNPETNPGANQDHAKDPHQSPEKGQ